MRRILFALLFVALSARAAVGESVDEAEAKRRGVSVEKVQLENARATIQALQSKVDLLQQQLERLTKELVSTYAAKNAAESEAKRLTNLPAPKAEPVVEDVPTRSPAARSSGADPKDNFVSKKYDRFKDETVIFLSSHADATHEGRAVDSCVICFELNVRASQPPPSTVTIGIILNSPGHADLDGKHEVIFIADGKRIRIAVSLERQNAVRATYMKQFIGSISLEDMSFLASADRVESQVDDVEFRILGGTRMAIREFVDAVAEIKSTPIR